MLQSQWVRVCGSFCALACAALGSPSSSQAHEPVSFGNEVMAVLSRAGCNQGACHGNQNGKNGFRLSLRGEDPAFDFQALTHDLASRRVDRLRPADSLVLLKAIAAIPHEGGRRFAPDSFEYSLMARWIAAGAPPDPPNTPRIQSLEVVPGTTVVEFPPPPLKIRVQGRFSDGTVRDLGRLVVFESSNPLVQVGHDGVVSAQAPGEATIQIRYLDRRAVVQIALIPARPNFTWTPVPETNFVDQQVFAQLRALRIRPSALSSDSVFLRRVMLDTLGVLPTAAETRAFLQDRRPDKRTRLVDQLLERPEFADFWALKWSDLLHNEEKTLDRKGVQAFHHWIRSRMAEGQPLNQFAHDLLAAQGSTYSQPAANFYRALREPTTRAEAVAQVFLGVRLQCARCHNHPFERWTQSDYHAFAAFFARIDYQIVENRRRDGFDKHEFIGEQIVFQKREGEWRHPRTGQVLPPRFLGVTETATIGPGGRLAALADWVSSDRNPFFARAQVNRIWFHLLGRGLVEPDDDFRESNPPVNAGLLEALTEDFVRHGYDLRHTVRLILNSRTYQLSAEPDPTNRDDENHFSHAIVRPLPAEPLLDGLTELLGVPVRFDGFPLGMHAREFPGTSQPPERGRRTRDAEIFLQRFGKPERLLGCDCERADQVDTTLSQVFQLVNGPVITSLLTEPENRLGRLLAQGKSTQEILEHFYLAALSRWPNSTEAHAALAYVERSKNRRAALEDVIWALVNCKEFLLRQ